MKSSLSEILTGGRLSRQRRIGVSIVLGALFVALIWIYTRDAAFPFLYHDDEPSKVWQILTGERNFHHPQFLLTVTEVWVAVKGIARDDPQAVAEAGRQCAAVLAAGTVVLLVLLAGRLGGLAGGFLAGVFLVIDPLLFEAAHYLKEEPALTFGLAASFLALSYCLERPTTLRAALLGGGLGLALAGKYVGILVMPPVLAALVLLPAPRRLRGRAWATLAAALAVVWLGLNYRVLANPEGQARGVSFEMGQVAGGSSVIEKMELPHGRAWRYYREHVAPLAPVLMLVWIAELWRRRRERPLTEFALVLFFLLLLLALSFSQRINPRYVLPLTLITCVGAGLALAALPGLIRRWLEGIARLPAVRRVMCGSLPEDTAGGRLRWTWMAPVVPWLTPVLCYGLTAVLFWKAFDWQRREFKYTYLSFREDSRGALVAWLRENLPPAAGVLFARTLHLGPSDLVPPGIEPDYPDLPQTVRVMRDDALTDLAALQEQGITHIAMLPRSTYYERPLEEIRPERREEFARLRDFYAELRERGRVIWSWKPAHKQYRRVAYLNVPCEVWELPKEQRR